MATNTSELIKLSTQNYASWKLQLRMALIRDDLWDIVDGKEEEPAADTSAKEKKMFRTRCNKALSTIVLSMQPQLHYLVGRERQDPVAVWKALSDHLERKTWTNHYELWKLLFSMPRMKKIKDGGSVNEHLKSLQDIFDSLAVLEDPVSENKQVMFILASVPESFQMMVTALAASTEETSSLANVKERVRSEELRQKQYTRQEIQRLKPKCHYCPRRGHLK